jgi:hypothetical protein
LGKAAGLGRGFSAGLGKNWGQKTTFFLFFFWKAAKKNRKIGQKNCLPNRKCKQGLLAHRKYV